jgi:UDP-galactopyranose mutase
MCETEIVVAGAGIWGCTVARALAESGKKVLVLEKRSVVGGNVRCETDEETGIEIHTYGSHIFHTHLPEVWKFISRFAEFKHYHPEGFFDGAWGFQSKKTVIMREYSATWKPGDEPYYPVDCDESRALLLKYQEEAGKYPNLVIGGRLGGYKYYDMDKSIASGLETVDAFLK